MLRFFFGFFLLVLRWWFTYFDTKIEPAHHSILHQVEKILKYEFWNSRRLQRSVSLLSGVRPSIT